MSAIPMIQENEKVRALLGRVDELAVLPHVVFKVLELSGSSEAPAAEMEKAIVVDPGFSSKVLVLANSAGFGLPKKVTSIKEAVMFLGFRTVRTIAMTVGVFDLFIGKNDKESLRRRGWWRHSVDSAVCARWISEKTRRLPVDDAYTCGLLHTIGKSLLDRFGGGKYDDVVAMTELGVPDFMAEQDVFGCNHAEIAVAAIRKWGLPPALQYGLNYIQMAAPTDEFAIFRACTSLSSQIGRYAREGKPEGERALPEWALEILGFHSQQAESLIDEGTQVVTSAQLQI